MRWSAGRLGRLGTGHGGRLLATGLVAVLVATVSGQTPAVAAPAQVPGGPAAGKASPSHERPVPGRSAKGHPRKIGPEQAKAARKTASLPAPVWPKAGTAEVSVPAAHARSATAKPAQAGSLPVSIGAPTHRSTKASNPSATVRVTVLSHRDAAKTGHGKGMLLRVARVDGAKTAAPVSVRVDYSAFRHAYGGGWASRLRLVRLPNCALTDKPSRTCGPGKPLTSRNDVKAGTVTANVSAAPAAGTGKTSTGGTVVALEAAPSGKAGDFAATKLSESSTWSAGGDSGDFSWSYPMSTPPGLNGPTPEVALSYSSASVDGRTEATNNQPSWIGEGFEYSPGYIERKYKSCSEDMGGSANNTTKTGDVCWGTDNAFLSMSGHTSELIKDDDSGTWRLKHDDGTRVQRLTDTTNGDNNHEYWKITTPDGVQYFFGLNRLPGWKSGNRETESVFTEPVFGNNSGEPCHASSFADSSCQQAWRWNLDYVVDPHGNTMSLWWTPETNKYAANMTDSTVKSYTRGGYLRQINYGTTNRESQYYSQHVPARVVFGTSDRCLSDCGTHDEAHWPDTPWDQSCSGSTCTQYSPTFWSTKRLTSVTTQVWDAATSAFTDVDSWTFTHTFPDPGDGTRAGLWLNTITHTGKVGGSASLPAIRFEWTQLQNRVDPQTGEPTMNWMRIGRIDTETGEQISVQYSPQQCKVGTLMPSSPQDNTLRCYPVVVPDIYHEGQYKNDWYHKYLVTSVSEYDQLTGSNARTTSYEYAGNPAWHHDDADGLTPAKRRTWSQFRGYQKVKTRVGDEGQQSLTETTYYRGMGGSLSAGVGDAQTDSDAFAGMVRQQTVYNGTEDKPVSRTVNEAWQSSPTATRTIDGQTVYARHVATKTVYQQTALDAGRGWRTTETVSSFDSHGMLTQTYDHGDTSKSGDEQCTTLTYDRNTSANILTTVERTLTTALACGTDPTGADDVISDTRTSFDGHSYGTAPTAGDPTRTEVAKDWDASGPTYVTTTHSAVDAYGRTVDSWDARGAETTTAYTPASGGPVTQVTTTNALGWTSTTELDTRGQTTGSVDVNNHRTDNEYDPLGRLVKVWKAPQSKADGDTPNATFDYTLSDTGANSVTSKVLNATANYDTSYAIFDGLLRQVQTQTLAPGTDGGRMITDTVYDSLGRKWKTNGPYYDTAAPSGTLFVPTGWALPRQTVTQYDRANRPTASILISRGTEQWRTSTYYGGDYTTVTPPAGDTPTRSGTDARGNTVELRQYHGSSPSGDYDATTYTYNRKNQLTTVTDQAGNKWTYHYDLLGHQTATSDPDHGTVTATYDDAGDLTSTTDARGKTLVYTYDLLGRKTGLYDGTVSDATTRATWSYDTAQGSGGKGLLASADRWIDGADYKIWYRAYNTYGEPIRVDYVIPDSETGLAGTYTYGYSWNINGSARATLYPVTGDLPSESVHLTYDAATGLPIKYTSGTSSIPGYVTNTTYTHYGKPETTTYQASAQRYLQRINTYDEATDRLTETRTAREATPTTVSDVHYSYDAAGNLTGTADATTGDTQCFDYDYLRRLTQAWTPGAGTACTSAPSTGTLGGPAPYWQTYSYNTSGNRTSLVNHVPLTTGGQASTTTYTYPTPGTAQPHTLTGTSTTDGSGTTTAAYTYDQSGNTLTRPGGSNPQTLTWDAEERLTSVTEGTKSSSYVYDAEGNRLIAHDSSGSTLYLPDQELHYDPATGAKAGTRYYSYQGQTFAVRSGGKLTWLVNDQQGTAQAQIPDSATQQPTWRRQDPFGNPRGTTPDTWAGHRGFVNGVQDPTGLTHLGARDYDPSTGRFVSDDPVTDASDPQQLHGYAYANNNPLTFTDPHGRRLYCTRDMPCGPTDKHHPTGRYSGESWFTGPSNWGGNYCGTGWEDPSGNCHKFGPVITDPSTLLQDCFSVTCSNARNLRQIDVHKANAWEILAAFLQGAGGTFHFQDGDFFAEQVRRDPWLQNLMKEIGADISRGKLSGEGKRYSKSYASTSGKIQAAKDLIVGSVAKDWEVTELGSYHVQWSVIGTSSGNKVKVSVHITNKLSNSSITHIAGYSDDPKSWHRRATNFANVVNPVPKVGTDINLTQTIEVG